MFCGLFSEIILPSVYALLLSVFVLQLTFCRSLGRFAYILYSSYLARVARNCPPCTRVRIGGKEVENPNCLILFVMCFGCLGMVGNFA